MQKTELSRTTNYTSRVDKPLEHKVGVPTKRRPQYLDVALNQDIEKENKKSSDLKSGVKAASTKDGKSNVTGSKVKSRFSEFTGVKNTSNNRNTIEGNKKENNTVNNGGGKKFEAGEKTKKVSGLGSPTFQEKSKFKSQQNQKLFQELDQMLTVEKHGIPEHPIKKEPMTSRSQKSEKVTVLTRDSFYQPSFHDGKPSLPKRANYTTVPPLKQNGVIDHESQIFHTRELRAKEQIASIDSYAPSDIKVKFGPSPRGAGNVSSQLNTQRGQQINQGVPINPAIVANRHHYIADIPIYLPTFEDQNQSTNQAHHTRPLYTDRTIPSQTNPGVKPQTRLPPAPEGITGPPAELSNLTNELVTKRGGLNSYRQQANPVRQRLIEEESKKFARDNLKYFDLDPKSQSRSSPMNKPPSYGRRSPGLPSYRSSRDYDDETMHSDPGSVRRNKPIEDLSKYKYSPEGFLAERERKARQERESRMLRESERKFSSRDFDDDQRRRDPSFPGRLDRNGGTRSVLRDNSWVKAEYHTPIIMDKHRKEAMREGRNPHGDSSYRTSERSAGSYKLDRNNSAQSQGERDRVAHRSYQIPSEIRDRDRYSERESNPDGYSQAKRNRDYYDTLRSERDIKTTNEVESEGRHVTDGEGRYPRERDFDKRYGGPEDSYRRLGKENDKQFDKDSREFRQYMEEKLRNTRSPILEEDRNDRSISDKLSDKSYTSDRKDDTGYGYTRNLKKERESRNRYASDLRNDLKDSDASRDTDRESSYNSNRNEQAVRQDSYSMYDRRENRRREESESASRKRKYSAEKTAERKETRTKSGELKVEYVLRNKSNPTMYKQDSKGGEGTKGVPAIETPHTEHPLKQERSINKDVHPQERQKKPSPRLDRNGITGTDKNSGSSRVIEEKSGKPITYETRVIKENSKHGDDFNKYFDDPENPNSPANRVPFYSDNSGRYAKEKYEFSMPETMTPVQKNPIRYAEEQVRVDVRKNPSKSEEEVDKGRYNSTYTDDITDRKPIQEKEGVANIKEAGVKVENVVGNPDAPAVVTKPAFLASTVNKHEIKEDRKSPWRKGDSPIQGHPGPKQDLESYPHGPDFGDSKMDNRSDLFQRINSEVRPNTEERRQKKREKTMDSQGPTVDDPNFDYPDFRDKNVEKNNQVPVEETNTNGSQPSDRNDTSDKDKSNDRDKQDDKDENRCKAEQSDKNDKSNGGTNPSDKQNLDGEEIDIDDLNLDDVETEMDERELYVCYLMTDDGDAIGPLKLDINDVQMGLPRLPTEEEKQAMEAKDAKGEVEDEGMRNRQTGSHGLNEFSSRSHSMLMLTIDSEQQDPDDENIYITKRGKLTFVDLAGSEKVKDSHSTADTLVESNSINKSLLVLGNCISSLGDSKRRQGHIPYRDSKLTKLLADSLGGNGVTLMICCITPSSHHAPETMNTLRYASRAKKIRTKPVVKMDPREKLILSLKREVKVLRNENHYLRQQLEFPAKPRGQLQKENDQKFMKMIKEVNGKPNTNNAQSTVVDSQQEKMKQNGGTTEESGLYEMLQEYMVENETLRTENADMQVQRDKIRQEQQLLYRDNEKLMKRVDELERRMNQAQTSWQSMPRQGSHPDQGRSRDHSPMGSPQYIRAGGSGGHGPPHGQNRLPPPPPNDLPLRENPALRDPVYPGSPPQGYNSPTSNGKGKQPTRGQPLKPPHRLVEPIVGQQRPIHEQNGINGHMGVHPSSHPVQYSPGGHPIQYRQPPPIGSPNRTAADLRMDSRRSSQSSSSDAIKDMNERLKAELMQLEGEIHHHTVMNHRGGGPRDIYGSQGSMR